MGDLSNDHSVSLAGDVGDVGYLEFCTIRSTEFLLSSHWDCKVRSWEIHGGHHSGDVYSLPKFEVQCHKKPVLSFAVRDNCLYTASCDNTIKFWNIGSSIEPNILGKHAQPVNHIRFIHECQCILSTSWDSTVAYWDVRTNSHTQHNPLLWMKLGGCIQAVDVQYPLMICASAERDLNVFDLRKPNVIFKKILSPLRHATNTHALKLFPDRHGFIVGSIEGRCGIHHIIEEENCYNFAFKCHRDNNKIYNVNSIDFHPQYSTFATTGGDGKFYFWDKDSKQRLRIFPRCEETVPIGKFNHDGSLFAYAVCYDWSKGKEYYNTGKKPMVRIAIHKPTLNEVKNRGTPPYESARPLTNLNIHGFT